MIPELSIGYFTKNTKTFKKRMNQVNYIPKKQRPSKIQEKQGFFQKLKNTFYDIFTMKDDLSIKLLKEAMEKNRNFII